MTVSAVSSTNTAAQSQAATSQATLSSNFNTFLKLLTAQLQNQDPLQPMDSNEFTQQLVQYSQVEQQISANQNLESLISLTKSNNASTAVSYLGKTVTITDGTGALQNGEANWSYNLDTAAASTVLSITDANGKVVYATRGETGAGSHSFTWNGQDSYGNQLTDGTYTLNVSAKNSDGSDVSKSIATQGVVQEVDLSGSEPALVIGPMSIPLSKASLIS